MLNGGKAVRNKDGVIVEAAAFQSKEVTPGRVQPDRRWFGNTRVISQTALDHFRTALAGHKADPYSVLLKRNKLPMGLIQDESEQATKRVHIVETEPFANTFGPKAQRKRPRLDVGSLSELGESSAATDAKIEDTVSADQEAAAAFHPTRSLASAPAYAKGTSRRIWAELYKVLDSSDVVIHVLDARDPIGTRCKPVVEYLRREKAHKHLVYVLNKVDLVPTWVTVSVSFPYISPPFPSPSPLSRSHTPVRTLSARFGGFYTHLGCYESGRMSVPSPAPHPRPRLGCSRTKKLAAVLVAGEGPRRVRSRPIELGFGPPLCTCFVQTP